MELVLFLVILLFVLLMCDFWGWFSSSSSSDSTMDPFKHYSVAEFSMEGFDDRKGVRRIENAKNKLTLSNCFWESAYRHLFAGCSEKNSYNIFDSSNSLGIQIQQVAQTSRKQDHMVSLLNHSKEVYEPSRMIDTVQWELQEYQLKLRGKLEEGKEMLQDSYKNIGQETDGLSAKPSRSRRR